MSHWYAGLSAVKLVLCDAVFWTDPRSGLSSAVILQLLQVSQIGIEMRELLPYVTPVSLGSVDERYQKKDASYSCCVGGFVQATAIGKECCRIFRAGFVGQQCSDDRWLEAFVEAGCSQASQSCVCAH